MASKVRLILASGSQGRKSLLESLGLNFEVVESNVDEEKLQSKDPVEMAEMRAKAKGEVVAEMIQKTVGQCNSKTVVGKTVNGQIKNTVLPNTVSQPSPSVALSLSKGEGGSYSHLSSENLLIIAADTVGFMGDWIFNKPTSRAEAEEILQKLSGKTHKYVSAHHIIKLQFQSSNFQNTSVIPASMIPEWGKAGIQSYSEMKKEDVDSDFRQNDKRIRKKVAMEQWSNGTISTITDYDISSVTFRKLTAADIKFYLDHIDYKKFCGAYKLANSPQNFTIRTEGSISNIIGLSLEKIIPILKDNFLL